MHVQNPRGCDGGRRVGDGAHTAGAERGLSPGMSGAGVGSLCRHPGVRCGAWEAQRGHMAGAWRDVGVLLGARQGRTSQLGRTSSQGMSPVPCVRDMTSPGHATRAGDTRSVPRLGSQQDGSFTGCARDRQRPRFVPLPSPLCPPRRDTPSHLTFSRQASTAGSGHQPGGAVPGTLQPGMGGTEFHRAAMGTVGLGRTFQAGWSPRGTRPWDGLVLLPSGWMDGRAAWGRSARLQPPFPKIKA